MAASPSRNGLAPPGASDILRPLVNHRHPEHAAARQGTPSTAGAPSSTDGADEGRAAAACASGHARSGSLCCSGATVLRPAPDPATAAKRSPFHCRAVYIRESQVCLSDAEPTPITPRQRIGGARHNRLGNERICCLSFSRSFWMQSGVALPIKRVCVWSCVRRSLFMLRHFHCLPHVLAAVFLFLPAVGHSGEPLPAPARAGLVEHFPNAIAVEWKSGFLNADAEDDVVAIVSTGEAPTDGPPGEALVVLYGSPKGTFSLLARSLPWISHERNWYDLRIRRRSIFLRYGCNALCGKSITAGHFQFKDVNGTLFLIGEMRTSYTTPTVNNDGDGESVDYLARRAIFWRVLGKERREVRIDFRKSKLLSLEAFDPSNDDHRPREIRGYLDERFKYVRA